MQLLVLGWDRVRVSSVSNTHSVDSATAQSRVTGGALAMTPCKVGPENEDGRRRAADFLAHPCLGFGRARKKGSNVHVSGGAPRPSASSLRCECANSADGAIRDLEHLSCDRIGRLLELIDDYLADPINEAVLPGSPEIEEITVGNDRIERPTEHRRDDLFQVWRQDKCRLERQRRRKEGDPDAINITELDPCLGQRPGQIARRRGLSLRQRNLPVREHRWGDPRDRSRGCIEGHENSIDSFRDWGTEIRRLTIVRWLETEQDRGLHLLPRLTAQIGAQHDVHEPSHAGLILIKIVRANQVVERNPELATFVLNDVTLRIALTSK